jgi:hypothetical protein
LFGFKKEGDKKTGDGGTDNDTVQSFFENNDYCKKNG